MDRACSQNGMEEHADVLKETFEKPRHRWEDSIRIGIKEVSVSMRNWIDSVNHRDFW